MSMSRWDPLNEALSLRDAVNQLFEESFVNPARMSAGSALNMPLDVSETEDAFIIEAVVPGVRSEDLEITLQDNVLAISAETRQQQQSEKKANYHRLERRYGRVSRAISLPTPVKADAVQASLENGILRLEVPKAEEVRPRRITINTGGSQNQTVDVNSQEQSS